MCKKYNWGPEQYEQAATFFVDSDTKNFIELNGGGKEILQNILHENILCTYYWHIRHFKEKEIHEISVYFKPDGSFYGFHEKLPDDQPGAALDTDTAELLGRAFVTEQFDKSLEDYLLIQSKKEVHDNGRIDHTFTYEHTTKKIGDAHYRIEIQVSGNKVTKYMRFIKVPESFLRAYAQMRSINTVIGSIASTYYWILYIFIGSICVLLMFIRTREVIIIYPIIVAVLLAFLEGITALTELPLSLISYDTAIAKYSIYLQQCWHIIAQVCTNIFTITIVLASAELLTRKAFGNHIQLWRLWRNKNLATTALAGRIIGAYLFVGIILCISIGIFVVSTRYLGWWDPSSIASEPDILATYFPWITVFSHSLHAGIFEESAFRAIPLAGALLIGRQLGRERLFLVLGFIIQILVFGAAHAHYPMQPAYARIIELIIPSTLFGLVYIAYGLLPSILCHVLYDVGWFALPIFLYHGNALLTDKILIIVISLIPLLLLAYQCLRYGIKNRIDQNDYNHAWAAPTDQYRYIQTNIQERIHRSFSIMTIIVSFLALIPIGYLFFRSFDSPSAYTMSIDRARAERIAQEHIKKESTKSWTINSWLERGDIGSTIFSWQAHHEWHTKLIGNYIFHPYWRVRFAQFSGQLTERAEQYELYIDTQGHITSLFHTLPESMPGASLSQEEATKMAYSCLEKKYGLAAHTVELVSVDSVKHPARLDWIFSFKDIIASTYTTDNEDFKGGQARITIIICGDTLTEYERYIHTPVKAHRILAERSFFWENIANLFYRLFLALIALFCGHALLLWVYNVLSSKLFFIAGAVLSVRSYVQLYNMLPLLSSTFTTDKSLLNQYIQIFNSLTVLFITKSFIWALLIAYVPTRRFIHTCTVPALYQYSVYALLGAGSYACTFLVNRWLSQEIVPYIEQFNEASGYIPAISMVLTAAVMWLYTTITLALIYLLLDKISHGGAVRLWALIPVCVLFGAIITGYDSIDSLIHIVGTSLTAGALLLITYVSAFRYNFVSVIVASGAYRIAEMARLAIANPFYQARTGYPLAGLIIGLLTMASVYGYQKLHNKTK